MGTLDMCGVTVHRCNVLYLGGKMKENRDGKGKGGGEKQMLRDAAHGILTFPLPMQLQQPILLQA